MAQVLFLNGMLNTTVLGLVGWVWIVLLSIIFIVLSNAYWWFMYWNILKPLHGLWIAYRNDTDSVLLSDKDNHLSLVSEFRGKAIFDEDIIDAKNGEKDWREVVSGQMGTIGTDIILDLGKWTSKDSEFRYDIQAAADQYNIENPTDQIHSLYKFMKYVDEGKIKVDFETHFTVDWMRINNAFPVKRNKSLFGGYIRLLAAKLDKEEKSKMDSMALYIIGGSIAISVLMIIGKFFMHKSATGV